MDSRRLVIVLLVCAAAVLLLSVLDLAATDLNARGSSSASHSFLPFVARQGTPSATREPVPLRGRLFFDMNGSGLADQVSLHYDTSRLNDERQPLHPDLMAAVEAYVHAHPDTTDGDLITIEEPGLSGYTVCANSNCASTDSSGSFMVSSTSDSSSLKLTIADRYIGSPEWEMAYINQWKGPVTVPEYITDVDLQTMESLTIVPGCDGEANALVCKLDEDTLLVREQYLNDTTIIPIVESIRVQTGQPSEVGLMQGWLNLSQPYQLSVFFDLDPTEGVSRNYKGATSCPPSATPCFGFDGHTGVDLSCEVGQIVQSFAPGRLIFEGDNGRGALIVEMVHVENRTTHGGHLSVILWNNEDTILRKQIIGLCGKTGGTFWPHIHFQLGDAQGQPTDPFQDLLNKSESKNFWIVYNTMYND